MTDNPKDPPEPIEPELVDEDDEAYERRIKSTPIPPGKKHQLFKPGQSGNPGGPTSADVQTARALKATIRDWLNTHGFDKLTRTALQTTDETLSSQIILKMMEFSIAKPKPREEDDENRPATGQEGEERRTLKIEFVTTKREPS